MAIDHQRSMPELRGKEHAKLHMEPKAHKRLMMRELQKLGLTDIPSYQRMRNSNIPEGLLRARAAGDLRGLRSAVRAARAHLGVEDPLAKLVGKVLSEAESCTRSCRDCLKMDDLQLLPSAMNKIEGILLRIKDLGLGSGVWKDPYLGAARRRLSLWNRHRPLLESLAATRDGEGSPPYCDAWAQLALQNSDELKTEFGHTVTKEILALPDAGAELARAMARVFSESREVDVTEETIMRFSWMLSQLDRGELDDLLLKPSSRGGSSLQAAALQDDILAFCTLYQTVIGEVVDIQRDLQLLLEKDAQSAPQSPCQIAAARLGKMLQLDPEHICLRRMPAKGLALRLLVVAGQPPAQQAQEVLGNGATVQPWRRLAPRSQELMTWHNAGNCVKELYRAQKRVRSTREVARMAEAAAAEAVSRLEEAKAKEAEANNELAAAEARAQEAKQRQEELWQLFIQRMEETRSTIRRISVGDLEIEKAKARDSAAEKDHVAAKRHTVFMETEAVEAATSLEEAKRAVIEAAAVAEEAMEASLHATMEATEARSSYQEVLHTPLAATPSRNRRAGGRAQSALQRRGIKGEARPRVNWTAI